DAAAREAEAESRDRALQAQIVKEAEAYQDLKRERDKALEEAAALKAKVEEPMRARGPVSRPQPITQSGQGVYLGYSYVTTEKGEAELKLPSGRWRRFPSTDDLKSFLDRYKRF